MASLRSNENPINTPGGHSAANGAWWHLPAQFALVTAVMVAAAGVALTFSVPIGIGTLLTGMLAALKCLR
ncbi:hypothetical protein ACT89R_01590 [Rhodococcus qingshengii]